METTTAKGSSWCLFRNYHRTFLQWMFATILQQGPMPKHLAIIMDGNRRFSKKQQLNSVTEGHIIGIEKLEQVTKMIFDLNIEEVTFYSFSEENYKRSPAEVKALMDLAISKIQSICDASDELAEYGVRWNVVGNWNKIPILKLKRLCAKSCIITRNNQQLTLHLAFSYSSHQEICDVAGNLLDGLLSESVCSNDLDENIVSESFTLQKTNPVDVFIRTGGDNRLSDFVLWQSSRAHLEFIQCSWPEFGYWDLLKTILHFQIQVNFNELLKTTTNSVLCVTEASEHRKKLEFIEELRRKRWSWLESKVLQGHRKV